MQSAVVSAVKKSSFPILHMCNQLKKKINRWHWPTIPSIHWLVKEMEYWKKKKPRHSAWNLNSTDFISWAHSARDTWGARGYGIQTMRLKPQQLVFPTTFLLS